MFVGDRMSRPVISVSPAMPMQEALNLMHKEKVRRLPVVAQGGKLVGIVAERDLLHASPSDATTLSVWEMNYLLSKIKVENLMTRQVVTVTADTPLEDAARIMADNRVGGLPVIRDSELVGMITETDLFKVFLEMLGGRESGVRAAVLVHDRPGTLAQLTKAVFEVGGNILALGTFLGESSENREVALKVNAVEADALRAALGPAVAKILDIRKT
jgi:acetoin utilization protein AcuB